MNWDEAIGRNGQALKRILAALAAMAGLSLGGGAATQAARTHLPRHLHRAVLGLLRPAESATRRLIIVVARGMTATLPRRRPPTPMQRAAMLRNGAGAGIIARQAPRTAARRLSFPLLDPLPRPFARRRAAASGVPRLSFPGFSTHVPIAGRRPPAPDDLIEATRLALRLQALGRVLDDLPAQARRFARWRARRDAAAARDRHAAAEADLPARRRRFRRLSPLRPGRPPGALRRPVHIVHEVLADLHFFALRALERPDTS